MPIGFWGGSPRQECLARTLSGRRGSGLVRQPASKSYRVGEAPPAFDLLCWNGDGTNLPCTMALQYLRGLCDGDGLAKGTFNVFGHTRVLQPSARN